MNSEIALNFLGNLLMGDRDNTPLGVDEDKDFTAFHGSLRFFHLASMKEHINRICETHEGKMTYDYYEYVQALRTLAEMDGNIYEMASTHRSRSELVIHTIPEIHIVVAVMDGTDEKPHLIISDGSHIFIHHSDHGLTPTEVVSLFSNIDGKLKRKTQDIVISGLKDIVPDSLKSYFLRGKFTKDMGHCYWGDGSFSMGHEIRLRATDNHDMAYAYRPDYFWQDRWRKRTFKNVVYSYWALTEIAARLPKDVEFVCQHRDDLGVSFTNEHPYIKGEEFLRRKAVLMVQEDMEYYDDFGDKEYMEIMAYCGLDEKYSLQEFIKMCNEDIVKLQNRKHTMNSLLGSSATEMTVSFGPDAAFLFFMKDRDQEWTRECFLRFPYDADLHFLKDIGVFMEKSKELVSVFNKSMDSETSVGLLRSWNS